MKTIKLTSLKPNPDNPRFITEAKFEALKRSIRDFPEMMALRPMVVDDQGTVLGGNMRLKALAELGYEDIPATWVVKAKDLTEEQRREFVVKDNIGFGDWDWDVLANSWPAESLRDWGLVAWEPEPTPDYGVLNDEAKSAAQEMEKGVMRAIQIEFKPEDYETAYELITAKRNLGAYVGGLLLKALKE